MVSDDVSPFKAKETVDLVKKYFLATNTMSPGLQSVCHLCNVSKGIDIFLNSSLLFLIIFLKVVLIHSAFRSLTNSKSVNAKNKRITHTYWALDSGGIFINRRVSQFKKSL